MPINLQKAQQQWEQLLELLENNEKKWEVQTAINSNLQKQITNLRAAYLFQNKALETLNNKVKFNTMVTTDMPEDVQEILRTME